MDDFFDEADIPDGIPFADFLQRSVGGISILLAIHTDTYASREWCRLEVLEAKRRSIPIVVLTATQRGRPDRSPTWGTSRSSVWTDSPCLPELVSALLREVLRAHYFPLRARRICALLGLPPYETFVYPPELLTALLYRERVARY